MKFPYELIEDPKMLSELGEWDEDVYCSFNKCQAGEMSEEEFRERYTSEAAILILNMTGFTKACLTHGSLCGFLKIFEIQKICLPVFMKFETKKIRTFADNFTVTFHHPENALEAAFEIHQRIRIFKQTKQSNEICFECSIGLGYGEVFKIGPDQAMGNEMNQTSKLGEDTAKKGEILITEGFYNAVKDCSDLSFTPCAHDNLPFQFYRVKPNVNMRHRALGS
jgi:class 3 adenylate cyclase